MHPRFPYFSLNVRERHLAHQSTGLYVQQKDMRAMTVEQMNLLANSSIREIFKQVCMQTIEPLPV